MKKKHDKVPVAIKEKEWLQVPEQEAKLRIYPMSIEPRAELPIDMKENYHFGEI